VKWINHKLSLYALYILLALAATQSFAATGKDFAECSQYFADGKPPILSATADLQPRPLCFSAFAVMHSGKSRTPIYVAERLNRAELQDARHKKRTNKFFADARLPRRERAELDDYQGSGYDRGHMAPAADMATPEAMAQCFSLANMVPQNPTNNRKAWANIEKTTRKYVMRASGDVYVITGPVFEPNHSTIGDNNVWVPQHLFKLVYDPSANKAWAHWIDNTSEARVGKPISYEELVRRTGVEFLPGWGK
jgi:endonuclease G